MGEINRLDSSIYNRISAGEVVERPHSVVKELVENSIDAGANKITVEIESGGKTLIRVTDNGSGIAPDDMPIAFLSHATSKIKTSRDLDNIVTLGFRGEALPSIASVATVIMESKQSKASSGYSITLQNGEITDRGAVGMARGTVISVLNLFENVPARAKFLKRDKSEEADITKLMADLILSNPNIAFSYSADGKTVYSSSGRGLEDAVYSVYSKDITNNLVPVDFAHNAFKVRGYVSRPNFTKPTRSYQTMIINGRIINNQVVSTAMIQAYGNNLMRRAFPVFVVDIIMPFERLDVNVTPNKTDVRFVDTREVFSIVYRAVKNTLDKASDVLSLDSENVSSVTNTDNTQTSSEIKSDTPNYNIKSCYNSDSPVVRAENTGGIPQNTEQRSIDELRKSIASLSAKPTESKLANALADQADGVSLNNYIQPSFIKAEAVASDEFRILGQVFDTYLLISTKQFMYIIDQHAAHEKMLYDKLTKEIENNYISSQILLMPEIIEVSAQDASFLSEMLPELQGIGLDIEEFGSNSFKITAVPSIFCGFKFKNYIDELLENKRGFQQIKMKDLLRDKLAMTACKSAIKGGDTLNEIEIRYLLSMMKDGLPLQCPHGRPAIIKFDRKDMDKIFKRIL